jgi:hypothetical protein
MSKIFNIDFGKFDRHDLIEAGLLVLFFFCFFYFGVGTLYEFSLDHQYPVKYGANDAFCNTAHSTYAQSSDQIITFAPYLVGGIKNIAMYQPALRILGDVTFSNFSGLSIYDTVYIMLMFFAYLSEIGRAHV